MEEAILEIGVLKQLTKSWKIIVEKFTFSNTEAWKPVTSLQKNSFIRDYPRILIRFLGISYNLISAGETGTKTHDKY